VYGGQHLRDSCARRQPKIHLLQAVASIRTWKATHQLHTLAVQSATYVTAGTSRTAKTDLQQQGWWSCGACANWKQNRQCQNNKKKRKENRKTHEHSFGRENHHARRDVQLRESVGRDGVENDEGGKDKAEFLVRKEGVHGDECNHGRKQGQHAAIWSHSSNGKGRVHLIQHTPTSHTHTHTHTHTHKRQ